MNEYLTNSTDSIRFKSIDDYIWEYMYVNPDTAYRIASKVFVENLSIPYKKGLTLLLRTIGASYVLRSVNEKAVFYYSISKNISDALGDHDGKASSLNGLGIIYSREGNYSMAIEQYLQALTAYEHIGDKDGMAMAYNNIGLNYERQGQFLKALDYYQKTLKIKTDIGRALGIAQSKVNLGNVYSSLKEYDKALIYYNDALKIQKDLNNTLLDATLQNSIGVIYLDKKEYDAALNYFMKALVLRMKMDDKYGATDIRNNLAIICNAQKKYPKAIEYAMEAHETAQAINNMDMIKETSKTLSVAFENSGKIAEALKYYKIYNAFKDSVDNKENTERSIQAEMKYEFAKQEEKSKLEQAKKDLEQKEAVKRQAIIRNVFIVGFIFLLIFAFLIYRNLQQKQRANKELQNAYTQVEEKSNLLEVKNKEITDSIKYAKRLQEAILPNNDYIKQLFPTSFVFYKPKDIVSGDFYWFEKWGNKKMFAAVDCTGHGVPGAFMSIVGYNLLNQAVNEHGLSKPSLILNALNKGITKTLKQTFEDSTVKDGMDIALCSYDDSTQILEYSGAYNSLWLIRNGKFEEVAADKHPIGLFIDEEVKNFTNHELKLQKGDTVYVFTDGYADQFGGPKGKKFKYKKLQELLIEICQLPIKEQGIILEKTIDNWKGDLEQIDDILIIGIQV
ncbi:MAG: tetratricopeptide repeat protein [Bacteroidia bacterium]|nr:tetratricopeptide repeat protein [Bacteroidia bacterium]